MEIFGGGGGGYPDDPYGGGWEGIGDERGNYDVGSGRNAQVVGGGFTRQLGGESAAMNDLMAASRAVGKGLSTTQVEAVPTMNIIPGQSQPEQVNAFVRAVQAAMSFSPVQQAMQLGMSMMPEQMRAPTMSMNLDQLTAGVQSMGPGFELGPDLISSSLGGRMNVPMSGSGAHLGIASEIANIGGQNVHMGPGMPMNENFYPGYGTNPFRGVAMADPSDPYIRKKRGAEIAALI